MSMNFRLLIRNLRMIDKKEKELIETLIIMNPGLDLEVAKVFIQREINGLKGLGLIPPFSGRQMQLILNNASTSVGQQYAVRA